MGVGESTAISLAVVCRAAEAKDFQECPKKIIGVGVDLAAKKWRLIELPPEIANAAGPPRSVGATPEKAIFLVGRTGHETLWEYTPRSEEWARIRTPFPVHDACMVAGSLRVLGVDYLQAGAVSDYSPLNLPPDRPLIQEPGDGWTNVRLAWIPAEGTSWTTGAPFGDVVYSHMPPALTCGASAVMVAPQFITPGTSQVFVFTLAQDSWSKELRLSAMRCGRG